MSTSFRGEARLRPAKTFSVKPLQLEALQRQEVNVRTPPDDTPATTLCPSARSDPQPFRGWQVVAELENPAVSEL